MLSCTGYGRRRRCRTHTSTHTHLIRLKFNPKYGMQNYSYNQTNLSGKFKADCSFFYDSTFTSVWRVCIVLDHLLFFVQQTKLTKPDETNSERNVVGRICDLNTCRR